MFDDVQNCAAVIRKKIGDFAPKAVIVLGSGLNQLADDLVDAIRIPYEDLPKFPRPTVMGHSGMLHFGTLNGVPVACMQGRVHGYEGQSEQNLAFPTRVMWALGIPLLVATNAAGSLIPEATPGNLMLITDHINLSGLNPLSGPNDDRFGPRFFDMTHTWDPEISDMLRDSAKELDMKLFEGVYVGVRGPNFETPAEIRMFQMMGGGSVGMSTVPEALTVGHLQGMKIVGVSTMTNMGAGITGEALNHEEVMELGLVAGRSLGTLLTKFVTKL